MNEHGDPEEQLVWMLGIMRLEMTSDAFSYFDAFNNLVLESSINCDRCGHVSKQTGIDERYLSIPIKPRHPSSHLQLYLKSYMDETIQGYRCENEKCKQTSDKKRTQKVAYAPDVLMVQLKLFSFSGQKDSYKVNFGPVLDLSVHGMDPIQGPLRYELAASILHQGGSGFGHYRCIAKGPNGKWLEFNDETVYHSSVKEAFGPERSWTPYLLFYERVPSSKPPSTCPDT